MKSKCKMIFFIPLLRSKNRVVGGQVTAARGLISYLNVHHIPHRVVDVASYSNLRFPLSRIIGKGYILLKSVCFCLFLRFDSALFFKSTNFGLIERLFPALILRIRRKRVGLFFRNSDILYLIDGSIKRWFVIKLLMPYSVFFVQGVTWKECLVGMGFKASRIVVIPNWLPPGFSVGSRCKPVPRTTIKFIFTGRIVKEKGVFEILNALSSESLKDRCEFVFAGDGPDLVKCEKLVRDLGIKDVCFMGALSTDMVSKALRESHVFVMPTYHPEGFPNSILEAMATGLPIIATDVGAICDSVVNEVNGFIISPKSSIELALSMRRYIDEPVLVKNHSKESLKVTLSRHDRNKNVELLLNSLQ